MEYNKLTLQDIEKAFQALYTKHEPLFKVSNIGAGLYKVECNGTSIVCSYYFLSELDNAIRKELFYTPELKLYILPHG